MISGEPYTEPAPEGLCPEGQQIWREATAALVFPGVQAVAVRIREQLRLEARVNRLTADRDVFAAKLDMVVARLGGTVEGHPTHAGNLLQRIDELRDIETERREEYEKAVRERRMPDDDA